MSRSNFFGGKQLRVSLQRHFNALPKFARVESRAFGHERPRNVAFYTSVNLCVRKHVRISVAVGLSLEIPGKVLRGYAATANRTRESRPSGMRGGLAET